MKTLPWFTLAALLLAGAAPTGNAANQAAVAEILKLKDSGMKEEVMVAFIQSRNQDYELSAADLISLRDSGVPETALSAMLASGRHATPATSVAASVAAPTVTAPATFSQDATYFYQELSPHGRWILAEDHAWYWQPSVVLTSPAWRPYWDQGHWVYTDHGWYWASDYSWGWAPFHYGRWHLHPHHGWLWFPDRVWAPAWVVWRSSDDYCGWAPLPPYAQYDTVAASFTFHGRRVDASFDFGLGWTHFNFCRLAEVGERSRQRIRHESELRTIYSRTTIVNNYTVINRTTAPGPGNARRGDHDAIRGIETHPALMNRGIDPARVSGARGRPVETVRIQDARVPPASHPQERLNTQTRTLEVYRPRLQPASPASTSVPRPALPSSPASPSSNRGTPGPGSGRAKSPNERN